MQSSNADRQGFIPASRYSLIVLTSIKRTHTYKLVYLNESRKTKGEKERGDEDFDEGKLAALKIRRTSTKGKEQLSDFALR